MTTAPSYFGSGYILIADDMANMRKTIKSMLRQVGIEKVREADDGDTAIKTLILSEEPCSFLLLDWNMPRMPGIQVAREVRAHKKFQDLPILMITADVYKDQIAEAGEIGISGYILKPFKAQTLNEKIMSIMDARTNPPSHVKLIKAGEEMIESGEYDLALNLFRQARKIQDSSRILVLIGEANEKKGNFDEALSRYEQAAEKNPEYLKAHLVTSELHFKTGNEEAALASLEKASEISPNNADRQVNMGKIYMKNGDEKKASKAFNAAAKHDPDKSVEIAEEYMKAGKAEAAEQFFRKSFTGKSDDVHILNRLGIALRKQGKWENAVKEYKKALIIEPGDEVIHYNLGKAYLEGKRNKEATDCFKTVLKINPDLEEAKEELKKLELVRHG